MSIDEYTQATGLAHKDLLEKVGISRTAKHHWYNKSSSPSLLNALILFILTDGHVGIFEMMSKKDEAYLDKFLDRIPVDRANELKVRLQNHYNTYATKVLGEYERGEDLL